MEREYVVYGAPISLFTRKLEAAMRFYDAPFRMESKGGENADAVYLVRSGAIACTSPEGRILGYYMSNSSFGERALTGNPEWPGDYQTLAATAVLKIPVTVFQHAFSSDPGVLEQLRRTAGFIVAEEMGESTGQYEGGSTKAELAEQQLDVMVGKQSVKGGEALVIDLETCVRCNACVESCVSVHEDGSLRSWRATAVATPKRSWVV